jgi:hypothetical protein
VLRVFERFYGSSVVVDQVKTNEPESLSLPRITGQQFRPRYLAELLKQLLELFRRLFLDISHMMTYCN